MGISQTSEGLCGATRRRRALVTGASGFIGSNLVQALERNDWSVAALLRIKSSRKVSVLGEKLTIFPYDGSAGAVLKAMEEVMPSVVFHLASAHAGSGLDNIKALTDSNFLLGTQLLETMRMVGCTKFVTTGTFWQHPRGAESNPTTLYAATKEAFETIVRFYSETAGIRSVVLKLYDTYGPGDTRKKVLTSLLSHLVSGDPLDMSPGEQKLDFVHVSDVCSAYLEAAALLLESDSNVPGLGEKLSSKPAMYSVATGRLLNLREVVMLLEKLAGKVIPIRWGARSYREHEIMAPWHGPFVPGWRAKITLEEGLMQLLDRQEDWRGSGL